MKGNFKKERAFIMKNELVHIRKNDVFTDSMVIAINSDNDHESIVRHISNHKDKFLRIGELKTSDLKSGVRGPAKTVYLLNEPQASFLITLLKNSNKVVDFKFNLVNEFYNMRRLLLEKQTSDWQQARAAGKATRKIETDIIRDKLIPLAIEQGSKNYSKFYMTYSKLINSILKINSDMRKNLPYRYLITIDMLERIIENIISAEADKKTHYKEIYQVCKAKCQIAVELSFLPKLERLEG